LRNTERPQDKNSDDGSEHFFIPLSTGASVKEMDAVNNQRKQGSGVSSPQMKFPTSTSDHYYSSSSPLSASPILLSEMNGHQSFITDDAFDQVFSPPLLLELESSLFPDTDEDLLGKYQKEKNSDEFCLGGSNYACSHTTAHMHLYTPSVLKLLLIGQHTTAHMHLYTPSGLVR
jgi:hypothetical protein